MSALDDLFSEIENDRVLRAHFNLVKSARNELTQLRADYSALAGDYHMVRARLNEANSIIGQFHNLLEVETTTSAFEKIVELKSDLTKAKAAYASSCDAFADTVLLLTEKLKEYENIRQDHNVEYENLRQSHAAWEVKSKLQEIRIGDLMTEVSELREELEAAKEED